MGSSNSYLYELSLSDPLFVTGYLLREWTVYQRGSGWQKTTEEDPQKENTMVFTLGAKAPWWLSNAITGYSENTFEWHLCDSYNFDVLII